MCINELTISVLHFWIASVTLLYAIRRSSQHDSDCFLTLEKVTLFSEATHFPVLTKESYSAN